MMLSMDPQAHQKYRLTPAKPSQKWLWLLVLAGATLLYGLTCQRGFSWQDSGDFQWRILNARYQDFMGLARAHPLYIALGRLLTHLPVGPLAFRINALSGLAMAVALANLAVVVSLLTGRRWIGAAVAAMLAVCHTVWWLSTIAEVYTLVIVGLTAELWLLVRLVRQPTWRGLASLAFVSGLGLCLHNFALLPLPVYAALALVLVRRRRLPAWSLAAAAGAWLVGALPYLAMTAQLAIETGDLAGALRSALVGTYAAEVFSAGESWGYFKYNMAFSALNFVNLLLPLAILGWLAFRKLDRALAWCLAAITAIHFVFFIRYPVPDQFTFILPTLTMLAVAAGLGLRELVERGGRRVAVAAVVLSVLLPPLAYASAPRVARIVGVSGGAHRELPFRDELRYWLVPWKQDENSAEDFAFAALRGAGPNGVILADLSAYSPVWLVQDREHLAPKVWVPRLTLDADADIRLDAPLEVFEKAIGRDRPTYVVTPRPGYVPPALLEHCTFEPVREGLLHRLRWPDAQDGPRP